jgi:hypothetical protein
MIASVPHRQSKIDRTQAKMGRSIKKFDMEPTLLSCVFFTFIMMSAKHGSLHAGGVQVERSKTPAAATLRGAN